MKVLLDTCSFLWIILDAPELSNDARTLFADPSNEVYLSAVSSWEIALKYALERLPLPEPPQKFVPAQRKKHRISSLPIKEEEALYLTRLPSYHKDPFDRLLICQSIVHGLVLLTPDEAILQYPVRTAW
ncbi:MAG: type II toxin-antitoxin system VapC family toxin [Deltaproteobacteria bacterium]|nr:type II toxin-antitoxin system VapC family toxin [Deltaproteobacteria bacterium]